MSRHARTAVALHVLQVPDRAACIDAAFMKLIPTCPLTPPLMPSRIATESPVSRLLRLSLRGTSLCCIF